MSCESGHGIGGVERMRANHLREEGRESGREARS